MRSKTIILSFPFCASFWVTKSRLFSLTTKQNLENCLNQKFFIVRFLENGFEATLRSTNVVTNLKIAFFFFFYKFLSGEIETRFLKTRQSIGHCWNCWKIVKVVTIFWESKANLWKLLIWNSLCQERFRIWL